ncbi:hypothetical protein FF2_009793 [Malus domestica]
MLSLGFLGVFGWRFLGSVWLLLLPRASISNSRSNLRPKKNCRSSSNRSIDSRDREKRSQTTEAREGRRRREEDRMEARPSFSRGLRDRRGNEGLRNPWKSTYPSNPESPMLFSDCTPSPTHEIEDPHSSISLCLSISIPERHGLPSPKPSPNEE